MFDKDSFNLIMPVWLLLLIEILVCGVAIAIFATACYFIN
jgi:hypothetical protein